jgi:predicted tellurium resistance membrane protein TerC
MEIFLTGEAWMALLTLTFLEIVLGVDNIVFISIVTNRLPRHQQPKARTTGLALALIFRVAMLASIAWLIHHLVTPLFYVAGMGFSIREIILFAGGLFLLAKSTSEIHHKMEKLELSHEDSKKATMMRIVLQIVALDIVFSFDSILTAVGLTEELIIMIAAVVISMIIMMLFSGNISAFISKNPTLEMLALSFLILIGFMLVLEGFHQHVPKGYIYFSVFFSMMVEILNIKLLKKMKKTQRKTAYEIEEMHALHQDD